MTALLKGLSWVWSELSLSLEPLVMLFLEFTRLFGWAKTLGLSPNGLGPLKSHTQLSEDPPISTNVQQSQSERELRSVNQLFLRQTAKWRRKFSCLPQSFPDCHKDLKLTWNNRRSYSKTYKVPRRPFESARLYVHSGH